ncbi:MAG: hypothetical protein WDZ94_05845 [Patescibacteria group bacterium]
MSVYSKLRNQAIAAAKHNQWDSAVSLNEQILASFPDDTGSFNRLGLAYLQLEQKDKAIARFTRVLELDRSNSIAKKQLDRIKSKKATALPTFNADHFIEEPGKTKIVELHRLAGKPVLEKLSVGKKCVLTVKKRYISVETEDGTYIGALPEDVSFRLIKLIQSGNTYCCLIQRLSSKQCAVFLKEQHKSDENRDTHSFPPGKLNNNIMDLDDRFLIEDDIPVDISRDDSESDYDVNTATISDD